MHSPLRALIAGVALLSMGTAFAQETITTEQTLVDSSEQVENALKENKGRATTSIEGEGAALVIGYHSDESLEIFMVPLQSDESYVPTDFMQFTLPKSENGLVRIDLTLSPGWTPRSTKYLLNILSKSENANAGFVSMEFESMSTLGIIGTAFDHLFTVEPYTPSSYHALRGYRTLSISWTILLGVLVLISCLAAFALTKAEKRLSITLSIVLAGSAINGLRFSVDLLRFTNEHVRGYASSLYDEEGSSVQIASVINDAAKQSATPIVVAVCRDGTNYKEKMVRYFAYPTRVTTVATGATLALVMDKMNWQYTPIDPKSESKWLRCGAINRHAKKLTEFPDGSILFSLQ